METINVNDGPFSAASSHAGTGTVGLWNYPKFKEVREVGESIEMIYIQTSSYHRLGGMPPYHDTRAFKIVYSCVDGKWNKSEPIYGIIIPATNESYEFNNE